MGINLGINLGISSFSHCLDGLVFISRYFSQKTLKPAVVPTSILSGFYYVEVRISFVFFVFESANAFVALAFYICI